MTPLEIRQLVEQLIIEARQKFQFSNMQMPLVTFDVRGTIAGKGGSKVVRFNRTFIGEPDFRRTVIHEVAHCVTRQLYPYSKPHGYEWKRVVTTLGGKAERCHSYASVVQVKGVREVFCGCSVARHAGALVYKRIRMGAEYKCKVCKQVVKISKVQSEARQL